MSIQITPEAFYDSLSLAHKLDNFLDRFKFEEIHLFAYFASILFLYKKNAISEWGYRFTISHSGFPFSDAIYEAINRHSRNGLFDEKDAFCEMTSRGADEFNKFKVLSSFKKREECLDAACTTSILVPYSQTIRALLNDPEMAKEKLIRNEPWIDQTNVYQKFYEISKAIGVSSEELLIPAVNWINFITAKEENHGI